MCAKSLQWYPTLCNLMDCSPPGSSGHGILQARILEWVAIPFSRDLSDPGIKPVSLMSWALARRFFTINQFLFIYFCKRTWIFPMAFKVKIA